MDWITPTPQQFSAETCSAVITCYSNAASTHQWRLTWRCSWYAPPVTCYFPAPSNAAKFGRRTLLLLLQSQRLVFGVCKVSTSTLEPLLNSSSRRRHVQQQRQLSNLHLWRFGFNRRIQLLLWWRRWSTLSTAAAADVISYRFRQSDERGGKLRDGGMKGCFLQADVVVSFSHLPSGSLRDQ